MDVNSINYIDLLIQSWFASGMFTRHYDLEKEIHPGKVLLLTGARQVGKTTLLRSFLQKTALKYKLDSGDNIRLQELLGS